MRYENSSGDRDLWLGYDVLVDDVIHDWTTCGSTALGLADGGVQINIWLHVLGGLGLIVVALVPVIRDWVVEGS